MKIGIGYDIHRLVEGRQMVLGGVKIPYPKGPMGHSDGDVLLHAICDAILGALGKGDIGMIFPDSDPKYKDISSKELLADIHAMMDGEDYKVNNLDCIIVAEDPKLGPYREKITNEISGMLKVSQDSINIKGKTNEELDEIGKGNAIAAHAAVLLYKKEVK